MAWDNYFYLTISSYEVLTDFPILINLSTASGISDFDVSDIFTHLGENKLKIKLEDSSFDQKYIEIESWDSVNQKAILHAKVTLNIGNNVFKLSYDNTQADNTTYVGLTGSNAARNVWDDNFKAVYTMAQNPAIGGACILDSTFNAYHGTPNGSMTSDDLVDGLVSKAIDFDGVDDYITLPTILLTTTYTFEILTKNTDSGNSAEGYIVCDGEGIVTTRVNPTYWGLLYDNNTPLKTISTLNTQEYKYIATTNNGTERVLFDNGIINSQPDNNTRFALYGIYRIGYGYLGRKPNAIMEHIRISNVARSDAWISATNNSLRDNLISFTNGMPYKVSGNIKTGLINTQAQIYVYRVSDGLLLGSQLSDASGNFDITGLDSNEEVDVVCQSPNSQYNDLIYRVVPVLETFN